MANNLKWGAALKQAGGLEGAAWRVGSSAAGGAVVGGGLDYANGNDSIGDGITTGAVLGAAIGAGSFAQSVNKLKVGTMTKPTNGLTSTPLNSDEIKQQQELLSKTQSSVRNTRKNIDMNRDIKDKTLDFNGLSLLPRDQYPTASKGSFNYGDSVPYNVSEADRNSLVAKKYRSQGFGW